MRATLYTGLALAAMLLPPAAAAAGELPEVDVKAYCKTVAGAVGGGYSIEKGCRAQEARAKRALEAAPPPPEILAYCTRTMTAVNGGYWLLNGCVEQEKRAKAELQSGAD